MPDPKHRIYVERGCENHQKVQAALASMRVRFGKENVELVIQDAPIEPDPDATDIAGRRIYRSDPDPD